MLKRTALYDEHVKLGGKLVDFAGFEMPVQYKGVIGEHTAVRTACGLFDVSHMGELSVKGEKARTELNKTITNDMDSLFPGKILYTPIPNHDGGIVDDMLVYMLDENDYLLVVNASNIEKDFKWFANHLEGVQLTNLSESYSQLALQGPRAEELLQGLTETDLSEIDYYCFKQDVQVLNFSTLVSRTGYTGEDGFEVYCSNEAAPVLFEKFIELGAVPCGLGARDTLRLEAALPLYGHELNDKTTPIETRLKIFVKPDKGDFIGKKVIAEQYANGAKRALVGIELLDKGVLRDGYDIQLNGETIGIMASGTYSPTLKKSIGTAIVPKEFAKSGTELEIIVRDKPLKAKIVKLPFYKRQK